MPVIASKERISAEATGSRVVGGRTGQMLLEGVVVVRASQGLREGEEQNREQTQLWRGTVAGSVCGVSSELSEEYKSIVCGTSRGAN